MSGIGHNSGRVPPVLLDSLDVFAELRRACRDAGGQKAWAEAHGLAPQHVNDVLACRREISDRILAALGLKRVERYARTSIGARDADKGMVGSIERQAPAGRRLAGADPKGSSRSPKSMPPGALVA